MQRATIFQAKTNLSKLVQRALQGEVVEITAGRERKPVVRLVPIEPVSAARRIGFLESQGDIGPEFFEPLSEDELRLWEGKGDAE